ncbi:hypothetical protein Ctob_003588 [Chrysochromulina tobinii]|uniref:Uncharacterized protein n=1 Tax=Chrysochromulina tobinii TaxID=1460289 RepID=A0A0M0J6G5_9EUKA|nr:hypothetical protein Ctob_003588 [Chrysochromulina tobinii]|eukprot:KOO22030.1 hypothetical protein Ctob_003588 [Chrysochromulina sp. CCMP291]
MRSCANRPECNGRLCSETKSCLSSGRPKIGRSGW